MITALVISGIFGLLVGSFLNVVIFRLPKRGKIIDSRSRCPHCRKNLRWFELIPVVSFIIQKGRCRRCRGKISWQYPLVESATGLAFVAVFWRVALLEPSGAIFRITFDWQAVWVYFWLASWWFYVSVMVLVFVYDLRHYLIPDKVIFPAIGVAFFSNLVMDAAGRIARNLPPSVISFGSELPYQLGGRPDFLVSGVIAAFLFSFLFFLLFWVSSGRWMGFGDVKLAVFLGLIAGFPAVILGAFWAFFIGSVAGVILIISGRKHLKSEVPFGPFLCLGTFLTFLFGFLIFKWYYNLPFVLIDYL